MKECLLDPRNQVRQIPKARQEALPTALTWPAQNSLIQTFVLYAYILAQCNTVLFKLASVAMQVKLNVLKPSKASDDN